MIYRNEVGELDFLSEDFLQNLDPNKYIIVTRVSGGIDTAVLTYLIAKEITERGMDFEILPWTMMDVPNARKTAEKVLKMIKEEFPSVTFLDHLVTPKRWNMWLDVPKMLDTNFDVAFFTNGTNRAPPPDIIGEEESVKMNYLDGRNIGTKEFQKVGIEAPDYKPFDLWDKRFVAALCRDLNLTNKILSITWTCRSKEHTSPCKECNGCKEKKWSFGIY